MVHLKLENPLHMHGFSPDGENFKVNQSDRVDMSDSVRLHSVPSVQYIQRILRVSGCRSSVAELCMAAQARSVLSYTYILYIIMTASLFTCSIFASYHLFIVCFDSVAELSNNLTLVC